jgi:hypothetical protein
MATFFGDEKGRGRGPRRFRALGKGKVGELGGEGEGEGEQGEVLRGVVFDVDGTLWYVCVFFFWFGEERGVEGWRFASEVAERDGGAEVASWQGMGASVMTALVRMHCYVSRNSFSIVFHSHVYIPL